MEFTKENAKTLVVFRLVDIKPESDDFRPVALVQAIYPVNYEELDSQTREEPIWAGNFEEYREIYNKGVDWLSPVPEIYCATCRVQLQKTASAIFCPVCYKAYSHFGEPTAPERELPKVIFEQVDRCLE